MPGPGFCRVLAPSSGWRLPRRGEENLFVTRSMSELGQNAKCAAVPSESAHPLVTDIAP